MYKTLIFYVNFHVIRVIKYQYRLLYPIPNAVIIQGKGAIAHNPAYD